MQLSICRIEYKKEDVMQFFYTFCFLAVHNQLQVKIDMFLFLNTFCLYYPYYLYKFP